MAQIREINNLIIRIIANCRQSSVPANKMINHFKWLLVLKHVIFNEIYLSKWAIK